MSKTIRVEYGGSSLWAADQSLSILLATVVEDAARRSDVALPASLLHDLRVVAVVGDYGLELDDVEAHDRATLVRLLQEGAAELAVRETLRTEDVARWRVLDDDGVLLRDRALPEIPTAPIVSLALAIVRMLDGTLEDPPAGHRWTFGFDDQPGVLAVAERTPPS